MIIAKALSNFAQGEVSPEVQGRVDISGVGKIYDTSLAYERNFISTEQGPFKRRTGTKFIKEIRRFGLGRNIPFVSNGDNSYMLSFSEKKLRFFKNGSVLTEMRRNITGITKATQVVVTSAAHGFSNGDDVYIRDVKGMVEVNGISYKVADVTTDTFKLYDDSVGKYVDSSTFTAYTSGGQAVVDSFPIGGIAISEDFVVTVTCNKHNMSSGDEVYIQGVNIPDLDNDFFIVSDADSNTFKLKKVVPLSQSLSYMHVSDLNGYTSGGSISKVCEVSTPYADDDLAFVQYTQNADVMYLTCSTPEVEYAVRKLTHISDVHWEFKAFTRTNDPFYEASKTITKVEKVTSENMFTFVIEVTSTAHGYKEGDKVSIHDVGGFIEVNNNVYTVDSVTANTYRLEGYYGQNEINSLYTSGGKSYRLKKGKQPTAVAFDTGRLWYAGCQTDSEVYRGSRGPDDSGNSRYDDFSVSTPIVASDAIFGRLPASGGKSDSVTWASSTKEFLVMGSISSLYRITGATSADPIVADDTITVKPLTNFGSLDAAPAFLGETLFYIQRNALKLRSLAYSILQDSYGSEDRNIIANRITGKGIVQVTPQIGRPDILWCVREDGVFLGLSYKGPDDVIEGWHRHDTDGEVVDIASVMRTDGYDALYFVVKRNVDGFDRYYIECLSDDVMYPDKENYISTDGNGNVVFEEELYKNYLWEVNKDAVFVDSTITYDGSEQSVDLEYDMGDDGYVTVTASGDVFLESHVGREIWPKYNADGSGGGRLVIETYNSATEVVCSVRQPLQDGYAESKAGEWYLTTNHVIGLDHLEGKKVAIIIDGALHKYDVVDNSEVFLDPGTQASKIHVGLNYVSIAKTNNICSATSAGSTHTELKSVSKVDIDVLESGFFKVGTSLSALETVLVGDDRVSGRVALPKTNIREANISDSSSKEKHLYIVQDAPYPLTVRGLHIYAETNV